MANDNFWLGVALGHFFGSNKNSGNNQQKGGCLSAIIFWCGVCIIGGIIFWIIDSFDRHPVTSTIVTIIVLTLVIFCIVKISKKKKEKRLLNEAVNEAAELFENGQYTSALEKAESVAEKDVFASDIAGLCYRNGLGCDKNPEKAFHYFEMAKDMNIEAAGNYGAMLIQGEGCTKDAETGLKYLKKAAIDKRYAPACYEYGLLLLDGTYIAENATEGRKYLRLASEGGIADATEILSKLESKN